MRCYDHKDKRFVCIKIIKNQARFFKQGLVEVCVLDYAKLNEEKHEPHNIVKMEDQFVFRNHLCIQFEILGLDLYEVIKKNDYCGLSQSLVKKVAQQVIECLRFTYKHNIIHCDMKPENILLSDERSGIKVIDFGSSCFEDERIFTYIQSRFYRAPEVMLGIPYTPAIDMWSTACIICELLTG